MWELDHKESWASENWCFWTVVLEKTLESPLDCKEIQPVHPKGNESCIFIGRTDAKAETPILWPSDEINWLIWKDPDARKVWKWQEKWMTEDEKVGWHHWLNGYEFEQALGVMDRKAWRFAVHGISKSQTQLSDWTELTDLSPKEIRSIYLSSEGKQMSLNDLISVLIIIWKIKLRQENIHLCKRESVKKGGKSHIIYFCSFDPLSIPRIL